MKDYNSLVDALVDYAIACGLTAEEEKTFCALLERITQNLEEDQTIC